MAEAKGTAPRGNVQAARPENVSRQSSQLQTRSQRDIERSGFSDYESGSPWQFMRRMSEEMDRAFDRIFDDFGFGRRSSSARSGFLNAPSLGQFAWSPRIEAVQKGDKFIVRAELPGVTKDDVEVNVTDDALTIHGQRKHEHEEQHEGFFHTERSYGSFYRTIPLPEGVIADSTEATFRDGVLEVKLQAPPSEVTRGRRVEVTDGSKENRRPGNNA